MLAQLSRDIFQGLLAASQMIHCLAKHLLCSMLVSSKAYLVKLTKVDHLLMASLPKVTLLVKLSLGVFILLEVCHV